MPFAEVTEGAQRLVLVLRAKVVKRECEAQGECSLVSPLKRSRATARPGVVVHHASLASTLAAKVESPVGRAGGAARRGKTRGGVAR